MNRKEFKSYLNRVKQDFEILVNTDLPRIIGVEAVNFFREGFDQGGFTDRSLEKWKPRKERRRKDGTMSAREKTRTGRPVLTGESGNLSKLRSEESPGQVVIYSEVPYAKFHNEGTDKLDQRKFLGDSEKLNQKIEAIIIEELDKILMK